MPGAVTKAPMKRGLAEANNTRANVQASPRSAKKLKLDRGAATVGIGRAPVKIANGSFNASQPAKSRFEEEVLEKMSQDIETLKYKNAERDQQWHRPDLPEDFNEMTHSLTIQQIDAEEGVLNGGKATIKLFGVTEVGWPHVLHSPS
jgi:DNA polymerase delta subunit 1